MDLLAVSLLQRNDIYVVFVSIVNWVEFKLEIGERLELFPACYYTRKYIDPEFESVCL